MSTAPASGGERFITVEGSANADATADGEVQQRELTADMVRRKLKWVDMIVFCIAVLEWAGNAVGTLASLWATVVLLGGFCSVLSPKDFWFSTVMIFTEATRVFIRNDALINQWLFGSTTAFRWADFSFRPMLVTPRFANLSALQISMFTSVLQGFGRPQIFISILKVALLVIISQMLSRLRGRVALNFFLLFATATFIAVQLYDWFETPATQRRWELGFKGRQTLKTGGLLMAWEVGTGILVVLAARINICARKNAVALGLIKVTTALTLACFPFCQAILASYYMYASISAGLALLALSTPPSLPFLVERHFFQIVDTVMPVLFFWSMMFPLPGISLKLSFYMLFSAIAAVLVGNLQIPVAFVQVLLSALRLRSLLGHHHHDYRPLPNGASPNLVPSIKVFFMLELFQGSSYMLASFLGLLSLLFHRLLARAFGLNEEWGAKAVNLYFRQAYKARKKGLLRSEDEKYTPSLESFAIESLRFTSSNGMQIVGLLILDNCLQHGDSKSSKKLITEMVNDGKSIITTITGNISNLITDKENSGDTRPNQIQNTHHNKVVRYFLKLVMWYVSYLTAGESGADTLKKKIKRERKEVLRVSLKLVRRLAINGGKNSARFRQELSENPFFLDSLEEILNMEDCLLELWEPVMDIIAMLALDETARQEIGNTKSIIPKLMHAFLMPRENNDCSVREQDDNGLSVREENDYDRSLRKAAGEALANLTIMSTDNCWDVLLADTEHNLVMNLIKMLEDEYYICVAANLLHNLCANSREKLTADKDLKSALPKVMQIIMTKEGKQLEAALSAASQICYVIPEDFAQNLESYTNAAAEELVEKLVNTLKSKEASPEYPRIRRVLVEVVISIVEQCPGYIKIFVEKKAKEALDKVKGTPSRLEKCRVFLGGEGAVAESIPMRDLVDKAKRLIDPSNFNTGD